MIGIAAYKAGAFVSKYKMIILAVIILVVVAYYFYRKGKKTTTIGEVPNETVNGGNGQQLASSEVILLASQTHEDVTEIFGTHDSGLYQKLSTLSDTDLARVYNAYNSKYQAEDGQTMIDALSHEHPTSPSIASAMTAICDRLNKYSFK